MERPEREERANALTHALGIVLSLVAACILVPAILPNSDPFLIAGCFVYLFSLLGLYVASTGSHWFRDENRRRQFRSLDQAFIYLLIVASYTPFSIVYLEATWWWVLLGAMWVCALTGFISKIFFAHRVQHVAIWIYIILGWMPALGGVPFNRHFPVDCLIWIGVGGVFYTAGTIFLFNDKRVWFFHSLWHLMVIAGSVIHFIAIMKFVV